MRVPPLSYSNLAGCRILIVLLFGLLCLVSPVIASQIIRPDTQVIPPQEDLIYVPHEDWGSVIQSEPEGIFVPKKEYQDLYRRAQLAYFEKLEEPDIPIHFKAPRIIEASYEGNIKDDLLSFTATYQIVQHDEKEQILYLPLEQVRYQKAILNDAEAHIFSEGGSQPIVKIPGPGSHKLVVEFMVPLTRHEKMSYTKFRIPSTLLNEVRIVADSYYDIAIPGAKFMTKIESGEQSETKVFLGPLSKVRVEVNNRRSSSEKSVQLFANQHHKVFLSEDIQEQHVQFMVDVQNDKVRGLDIEIPSSLQVHTIKGKGIAGWTRVSGEGTDVLKLVFHIGVLGVTQFDINLYQYREDQQADFVVGDVRLREAADRQGQLEIFYDPNLRIDTVQSQHLRPIVAQKAHAPAREQFQLYRRLELFDLPFDLTLQRVPLPQEVEMAQYNQLRIEKDKIDFRSTLNLMGLDEGTSQFMFTLPREYRLQDLQVHLNNKLISDTHKHHQDKDTLEINITHPVRSVDVVSIMVVADQVMSQEQWQLKADSYLVPYLRFEQAKRTKGSLRIEITDELLLEEVILQGYRPTEEYLIAQPQQDGLKAMVYHFRENSPQGELLIAKRRAEQTSETVTYVAVDEDLLRANAYLRYQITAGSQDQFYFAVPAWSGSKLNIDGANIKEKKKLDPHTIAGSIQKPLGVDLKGYDIWSVVLQQEVKQTYDMTIEYQKKIQQFEQFRDVPLVIPLGVSNDTGYVVLEASKSTKITSEKIGLSEVETYELPTWPSYEPSNRILEALRYFTQPFVYRMAVKRMDELPVLAALIKHEKLSYTFDRESHIFFEGTYSIRNTNQQYLQMSMPQDFVLWGATVGGQGIKPRKGGNDQLYIPLPVDTSNDIQLRITGQLPKKNSLGFFEHIKVESPQLGMPVLESNVRIYYPKDYALLNAKGNFEKLPAIKPQKPLLGQIFGDFLTTITRNFITIFNPRFIRFGVQGRLKSAADDIGDQFTAGNTSVYQARSAVVDSVTMADYRASEEQVLLKQEVAKSTQYEPYYLSTEYAVAKDKESPKKVASSKVPYARKKGLLSLSIQMPQEGGYVSANKLWGDSRLGLTFLAGGRERVLGGLVGLLVIAFGFFVHARKIMTPFMFCIGILVGGTLFPLVMFQSYIFLFNGAVMGALVFFFMLIGANVMKKFSIKYGLGVFLAALLMTAASLNPAVALAKSADKSKVFPDISVYVPYGDTPDGVNNDDSVYVPTEDYFLLKEMAEPPYKEEEQLIVRDDYHVSSVVLKGILDADKVRFTAQIDVFVNKEKEWQLVQLPFGSVFVEKVLLDGQAVPVKVTTLPQDVARRKIKRPKKAWPMPNRHTYEIPVFGKGHHKIEMELHAEVFSQLGKKSVTFLFPRTPFVDLFIDFQRDDVFVEMNDPGAAYYLEQTEKSIQLHAVPTQRGMVNIAWFPRKYVKKSEKPLIYAESQMDFEFAYDHLRLTQDWDIRVEKSSIASLDFVVPRDMRIEDVYSNNVKSWQIVREGQESLLTVLFKKEVSDLLQLTIKARKHSMPDAMIDLVVPQVKETSRMRGQINLFAETGTRLKLTNMNGLTPAAVPSDRTSSIQDMTIKKSYAFINSQFSGSVQRTMEERRITAKTTARHGLVDDLLTSHYHVQLDIKKNKLDTLVLTLPEGHHIENLQAPLASGHILDGQQLVIPLIGGVQGTYQFTLTLSQELMEGQSISLEGVEIEGVEKQTGSVSVYFPRGYEVTEDRSQGLKTADTKPIHHSRAIVPQYGASYGYDIRSTRYNASYSIVRKAPVVDAVKVYHATVEDSLVNVDLLNLFTIKSAPIDHISMMIPADISDAIIIEGDNINTILKKPTADGKKVAVRINLISKVDRSYLLHVSFKKYFNQEQNFQMPQIEFPQLRDRTEFISVSTETAYQVNSSETIALVNVEADTIPALPEGVEVNDILWAYRAAGSSAWNYGLELQRLAREKLVKANIVRQDIKSVIIPSGYMLNEVVMRVNNRTLQFLPVQLPKGADLWSLKVANESVKASHQSSDKKHDSYLIPLVKSGAGDRSFTVKFVYLLPINKFGWSGKTHLGLPKTNNIPVEKTTLTVLVPDNYQVDNFKTNTEEIDVSLIVSEKTLDLANELKYFTNLASTSKGGLKKKALKNRAKVIDEIGQQYEAYYTAQDDLKRRVGNKKFNQKLVQTAQMKNVAIFNEADQIIKTNQSASKVMPSRKKSKEKSYSRRRNVKGWNFKTDSGRAQDEVQQQVSNYLTVEDQKQQVIQQQFSSQRQMQVGYQASAYDPNMDLGRVGQSDGQANRQRAVGGFQTSSYDTRLGLIQGLGDSGPPQQLEQAPIAEAYRGGRTGGRRELRDLTQRREQVVREVSNINAQILQEAESFPGEVAADSAVQGVEFWGGGHVVATGAVPRSTEAPSSPPAFWDQDGADNKPQPVIARKSDMQAKAEVKQSTLLKGYRSIDIPMVESGQRYSFKKLGGNPEVRFSYRKRGAFARAGYLALLVFGGLTVFGLRHVESPLEAWGRRIYAVRWNDLFNRMADSNVLLILCVLIFLPALFSGLPLAGVTLGLISISLLRRITQWRARKRNTETIYSWRTFLHYGLSYTILLCLLASLFVYAFIYIMFVAVFFNWIYLLLCGGVTLFTRRVRRPVDLPDEILSSTEDASEDSDGKNNDAQEDTHS